MSDFKDEDAPARSTDQSPDHCDALDGLSELDVPLHRILFSVGGGGTGTVYKAVHEVTERPVAIKVVHDEGDFEKLSTEAKLAKLLDHPGICKIYSHGKTRDGRLYLAMEWIDGTSIASAMHATVSSEPSFRAIMNRIFDAVEYAHGQGVIHRDLKPGNIMLVCDSAELDGPRVKVIDFGIARFAASAGAESTGHPTRSEGLRGSPLCMSPEQCRQERGDRRSDIYALGVIMYELMTGSPPFSGDTALDVMYKHLHQLPPPIDHLPGGEDFKPYVPVVMRCLEKDQKKRYQFIGELRNAFNDVQFGKKLPTKKGKAPNWINHVWLKSRLLISTVVVFMVLTIVALSLYRSRSNGVMVPLDSAHEKGALMSPRSVEAAYSMLKVPSVSEEERDNLLWRLTVDHPREHGWCAVAYSILLEDRLLTESDYNGAERYCNNAISELSKFKQFSPKVLSEFYNFHRAADSLHEAGMLVDEQHLLESVIAVLAPQVDPLGGVEITGETYRRLGRVYSSLGDIPKSNSAFESALRVVKGSELEPRFSNLIYSTMARSAEIRGQYKEAAEYYSRSIRLLDQMELYHLDPVYNRIIVPASSFLLKAGENTKAESLFKWELKNANCPVQADERNLLVTVAVLRIASIQILSGSQKKGLALLEESRPLFAKVKFIRNFSVDGVRAGCYLAADRIKEASSIMEPALLRCESNRAQSSDYRRLVWIKGGIELARGNRDCALQWYRKGFDKLPALRCRAQDPFVLQQMKNCVDLCNAMKIDNPGVAKVKLAAETTQQYR